MLDAAITVGAFIALTLATLRSTGYQIRIEPRK